MTEGSKTDTVDSLLSGARNGAVPSGLMERVLADAERHAPGAARAVAAPSFRARLGEVIREIGGWPSMAGFAAASAAGIVIGIAAPETVFPAAGSAHEAGFEIVDLVPGYGIGGTLED